MTQEERQEFYQKILNRSNEPGRFSSNNGIRYDELDLEHATGHFVATPDLCNPFGICHGGAYYTLMDQLAGMLAGATGRGAVTMNCSVSYLTAAKQGDTVRCVVKPVKVGRSVGVYRAECFGEAGELQCEGTFHMFFLGDVTEMVREGK